MPTLCCIPKEADKKQEIIIKKMCWWIYSYVILSITSKIFSSLQDRKLGEWGEDNICPVKQNLEQEERNHL